MIEFTATILKFAQQGEKTGWSYIEIPAAIAEQLKPGNKKSFRVKGKLDEYPLKSVALLPMGEGNFIMALNATRRKGIRKNKGARLQVQLTVDESPMLPDTEFMACMADESNAIAFFNTLPKSHQIYFSKWIESAKTEATKAKRIGQAIDALSKGYPFNIMIRMIAQNRKDQLMK